MYSRDGRRRRRQAVALDLETARPVRAERLAALLEEREAVNAEAIAFRKAAKKAVRLNLRSTPIPKRPTPSSKSWTPESTTPNPPASIRTDPKSGSFRFMAAGRAPRSSTSLRPAQRPSGCSKASPRSFMARPSISPTSATVASIWARCTTPNKRATDDRREQVLARPAVKHYLKVDLDKDLQTSDWATPVLNRRPDPLRRARRHLALAAMPAAVHGPRPAGLRLSNSDRRGAGDRQDEYRRHRHRSRSARRHFARAR